MKINKLLIIVSSEKLLTRESASKINDKYTSMDYKLRIIPKIKRMQETNNIKIIAMDSIARSEIEKAGF